MHRWRIGGPVAASPRGTVPPSFAAGEDAAKAIIDGAFLHNGQRFPFAKMPWSVLPGGPVLAERLHGFAWLEELRAEGSDAARQRARELVDGWLTVNRRWTLPAWQPRLIGRRLISWLAAADFLGIQDDGGFRDRLFQAVAAQARHLAGTHGQEAGHAGAFAALVGLAVAGHHLDLYRLDRALAALDREVGRQVLADGGHVQRNPSLHLAVMKDLLALRALLADSELQISPAVQGAIERMAPVLRLFRHADGGLALFHGAKEEDRRLVDHVLAETGVAALPLRSAPACGFHRLSAEHTVVLVDGDRPPVAGIDELAHAAPLAFEVSSGAQRLIVNCGAHAGDDASWRRSLRTTAAHSTLCVDDKPAVRISRRGNLEAKRLTVSGETSEADEGQWFAGVHNGYRASSGLNHHRRLFLAPDGGDLRGEDRLEGRRGKRFDIRFHVHPAVTVAAGADRGEIILTTPSEEAWRFVAVGGSMTVDASTYLGNADIPERCQQIIVSGPIGRDGAVVKWALRRVVATPA